MTQTLRSGHHKALAMLANEAAFKQTRGLYERLLGPNGVYFRLTARGLTATSLDHDQCPKVLGVGGRGNKRHILRKLPPSAESVQRAYEGYLAKVASISQGSTEGHFAMRLIRHALGHGLVLPNSKWCFFHQEWRLPTGNTSDRVDLLGLDLDARRLVVIELKASEAEALRSKRQGRDAEGQVGHYADILFTHREALYPFFEKLAHLTSRNYGGPNLKGFSLDRSLSPSTAVWWP